MASGLDIPGWSAFANARKQVTDEESRKLQQAIGVLSLQGQMEDRDLNRQLMPSKLALLQSQVAEANAKNTLRQRETAFRDPANLAQFMTGGSPAIPPADDSIGGGPGRAAVQGQLDPRRLLQGAVAAGVVDPLAYAKEQQLENKPLSMGAGGAAIPDGMGGWKTLAPESRPTAPGTTRQVQIGDQNVTQEFRDGKWDQIAQGPKFSRQVAPIVNVGGGGGGGGKAPSGYQWGADAQGNRTLVPIPGGPADRPRSSSSGREENDMIRRTMQFASVIDKSGFNESYANIDEALKKITPETLPYLTGPRALLPDVVMDRAVTDARQALQRVLNITLKDRSGAAVTVPEWERFKKEAGVGLLKKPEQVAEWLTQAKTILDSHYQGVAAGFPQDVRERYFEERGRVSPFGGAARQTGPAKVSTDADYNALPSGAEYTAPDGSTRRKR